MSRHINSFVLRLGRKPTICGSFVISGIACITVAFIPTHGGKYNLFSRVYFRGIEFQWRPSILNFAY